MSIENLKKILESERDIGAEKYGVHIVNNMHSLGTYKKADYKAGSKDMENRLLPLLQKAVEILNEINIDNPSFEDSRLEWMEIQIDKTTVAQIREFLSEFTKMTEIKKEGE